MLLKTILNNCCKFKSFIYEKAYFVKNNEEIEIIISPRKNSKPICSCCYTPQPGYDVKKKARRFEFIPIWGIKVFFVYRMRRVQCQTCGVKSEKVPWADGKNETTKLYMQFLAHWAKKLSWKEVAESFQISWEKVFKSVEYVVEFGLKHRFLEGITAIGVDEVLWHKGHKYLTLVYQINQDCTRLLWIGKDRCEKTFSQFFDFLGEEKNASIKYVCSDMWKPYLKVIKERLSKAIHILDRFHIVARINKSLDEVRAKEHRRIKEDGYEPVLTKTRWLLLKKPKNLIRSQKIKLKELLQYNLQSVRAYLLKEEFNLFWEYTSIVWAKKFLKCWLSKVMKSKIEPLKKEAQTIKRHEALIFNWFKTKKTFSSGVVEGLNNKIKLTIRKSYGFKSFKCTEIALYHALGKLPEPPLTHRFY